MSDKTNYIELVQRIYTLICECGNRDEAKNQELSYKIYTLLNDCDSMGQVLTILIDTIVGTVVVNVEGTYSHNAILEACIIRLREHQKLLQK